MGVEGCERGDQVAGGWGVGCRRDGAPATRLVGRATPWAARASRVAGTGVMWDVGAMLASEAGAVTTASERECRSRGRASQGERAGRRLGREPPQKGRMSLPGRRRGSRWRTNLGADSCGVEGVGLKT